MENLLTHDERPPLQKLRRSQLWRIAVARNLRVSNTATKDQLLPMLFDATDTEIRAALMAEYAGEGLPPAGPVGEVTAEPLPVVPPPDLATREAELRDLPHFSWSSRARAANIGLPTIKNSDQIMRNPEYIRKVAEHELRAEAT